MLFLDPIAIDADASAAFGGLLAGLMAFIFIIWLVFLVLTFAVYIYTALAYYAIAKKTKTKNPWLAFIPIANIYLMSKIAKKHWWPILLLISYPLMLIPPIGIFIMAIGMIVFCVFWFIWLWNIFERVGRPGWWALLFLIPLIGPVIWLVLLGVAAWGKN